MAASVSSFKARKYMLRIIRLERTKNFPKNCFLPPDTHMFLCVSGGKNYLFIWKL